MTQIDFYILQSESEDSWLRFVCKIVDKAFNRDMVVFIYSSDEYISQQLDKLLWTFSQNSFLPHVYIDSPNQDKHEERIFLSNASVDCLEDFILSKKIKFDLIINLALETPSFFNSVDRLIEVIDNSNRMKDIGRKKFAFYKKEGYEINTHKIS